MATVCAATSELNLKITCLEFHAAYRTIEMVVGKALEKSNKIKESNDNKNGGTHSGYYILPHEHIH
jgi:hypothetical protein